ncbi:MAG: cupredoxin domain-containing protein [Chloroflexia bacterium]
MTRFFPVKLLTLAGLAALLWLPSIVHAQGTQQVTITATEFKLTPGTVTVPQGQAVQFTVTNSGAAEHNFKVEQPDRHIEQTLFSTNLKPGETRTASFTFPVAGDWEMYCPVDSHEAMGMKGTIHVEASASPAMPSTGAPSDFGGTLLVSLGLLLLGGGLRLKHRTSARRA